MPIKLTHPIIEVTIKPGSDALKIAYQLNHHGIDIQPRLFYFWVKLAQQWISDQPKAGTYAIQNESTPHQILMKMVHAEMIQIGIIIIEGWTFQQMREVMNAHSQLVHDSLKMSSMQLLQAIGADLNYFCDIHSDTQSCSGIFPQISCIIKANTQNQIKQINNKNILVKTKFKNQIDHQTKVVSLATEQKNKHSSTKKSISLAHCAEISLEGLFFPNTYIFNPGISDLEIYKQAYQAQQKYLIEAWQSRSPNLPYRNLYEALIMASIIEKETGSTQDRSLISAVFTNRLKKNMRLQTDPSVIYGIGKNFNGNLRRQDLLTDTPYNTYTRLGLPPTPISLPGKASITAALHPAKVDLLYFVARGDGSSVFSKNLSEHNRAVDQFQRTSQHKNSSR